MRFKTKSQAPDIEIEPYEDGQKIVLMHRYMTGYERLTAMELGNQSLAGVMAYFYDFVIGWNGVEDQDGAPLPLKRVENGESVNMLDFIIGQLPLSCQGEIWFQWLLINGVANAQLNEAAKNFIEPSKFKRLEQLADRLGKSREPTPSTVPGE